MPSALEGRAFTSRLLYQFMKGRGRRIGWRGRWMLWAPDDRKMIVSHRPRRVAPDPNVGSEAHSDELQRISVSGRRRARCSRSRAQEL